MYSTNHGSSHQERGNSVENKSLLNDNTDLESMQYEWEMDQILSKKETDSAQLSHDIILTLIVSFVIIIGLAVTYIFLVDYLLIDVLNPKQQYTDTDDAPFRYINTKVTSQDVLHLRKDLQIVFDASKSLIATTIALVFNDCSGPKSYANGTIDNAITICDGCIDTGLSNHPFAIEPLEKIYYEGAYDQIMSRSDFWAMAGTVAIQTAAQLKYDGDKDMLPSLALYFGRIDCHSTPFASEETQYPSVNDGFSTIVKWFATHFGFNVTEMVVLLGAHTLRRRTHGNPVFDNGYFVLLADQTQMWHQQSTNRTQYVNKDETESMLNSDMCLVYDIDTCTL
eukprot:196836_1